MKMTKKKVFVAALAICLVAIISMGTLAWFSDSESVDNKFLFATTEDDTADEVFNVVLEEPNAPADKEYKDIEPGAVLDKDPTVTNAGYYDQYIRATVTIKNAAKFVEHIMEGNSRFRAEVFQNFDADKWRSENIDGVMDTTANTITYTFYYHGILAGEQTTDSNKVSSETLFTAVIIPGESLSREDVAELNKAALDAGATKSFEINVKADAVQTENVVVNATPGTYAAAMEAFKTVEGN